MANIKQSKKRARQAVKRRSHNVSRRSMMRTYLKKVLSAIEKKDVELARKLYQETVSLLDRLATKNMICKNKASRHKTRLNAKIKALSKA